MLTPDSSDPLAYVDVGQLFELVDERWELFEPSLLDRNVWAARVVELNKIRRRIAHCRRPHADDLSRLEQTLRDLSRGAFEAMASFNDDDSPDATIPDPVVEQWGQFDYPEGHIVRHAASQYRTRFALRYSTRPWASAPADGEAVSGKSGVLWHAYWHGGYIPDPGAWWRDSYLDVDGWRDLIVYACPEMYSLRVTFAAVDDPVAICRGIEHCFQPTLNHRRPVATTSEARRQEDRWNRKAADLDQRVQVGSGWAQLQPNMWPADIFGV